METEKNSDNSSQDTSPEAKSKTTLKQKFTTHKKKILIASGVVLALLFLFWVNAYLPKKGSQNSSETTDSSDKRGVNSPVPGAIAKVGEEYIFQSDLDVEMANYPGQKDDNAKKVLMEKLVKDSIVLQSASKEKLASVSSAIYNTSSKDYGKRFATLNDIKVKKNNQVDHIEGGIISVWFHNYEIPKMGLEKAKQMAFDKISALHKRVENKELTIEQAGKSIQNDSSYAQLDVGYRSNAFVPFKQDKGEFITVDDALNKVLWSLKPGQLSPVMLGRNLNGFNNKVEEAFYAFGQISSKVENGVTMDFDAWVESQKNNYEVSYY